MLGFPVPKASTRPLQKASTLELAGNQWVWRERAQIGYYLEPGSGSEGGVCCAEEASFDRPSHRSLCHRLTVKGELDWVRDTDPLRTIALAKLVPVKLVIHLPDQGRD